MTTLKELDAFGNPNNSLLFFLVGFMGSGKTHWGKRWAAANAFQFIDIDELIEQQTGNTIRSIFEQYGEDYFRKIEADTLKRIRPGRAGTIVACGGGTPCFFDNMQWMNEHGITIYLRSSAEQILQRVLPEQSSRPLLKEMDAPKLLSFIRQKLAERSVYYEQAKCIVSTSNLHEQFLQQKFLTKSHE